MARPDGVAVVLGTGGIGAAVARRLTGSADVGTLVLADRDTTRAESLAADLAEVGPRLDACSVDVADRASVAALAARCAEAGPVRYVVHTAGVSPAQADVETIWAVDLRGTAHVLDELGAVVAPGGAGVVVASLAGHLFGPHLDAATCTALASRPADELGVGLPGLTGVADPQTAYGYAKRGNQLRVRAVAGVWGRRGARVNSVSPGLVDTEMGRAEAAGPDGGAVRALLDASAIGRPADPGEVADVVEFLLGAGAAYVTGTDLAVDGGVLAALAPGGPGDDRVGFLNVHRRTHDDIAERTGER